MQEGWRGRPPRIGSRACYDHEPTWLMTRILRAMGGALVSSAIWACGNQTPPGPSGPVPEPVLDRVAVIQALQYWESAAGISFAIEDAETEPRLLIRAGTDVLNDGGRGVIDGTYPNNQAKSGLVVFATAGGPYCVLGPDWCRFLYRHEIGHALGFLEHSNHGLMFRTPDTLVDRELAMITALYSLPHGARVEPDGTWRVEGSGQNGVLVDLQAARDIIDWNMNGTGGQSFRSLGTITRWQLPVRVVLRDR